MDLSIVVATTNRPTLRKTLTALAEIVPGAEVILAFDGKESFASNIIDEYKHSFSNLESYIADPPFKDYGGGVKQAGMGFAERKWISFIDDDDIPFPAYCKISEICATRPDAIHMFRMRRRKPFFDTLWRVPLLVCGNVSTQMFVVPNEPAKLGSWTRSYEADFHFIQSTAKNFSVSWHQEIIALWNGGKDE